MFLGQEITVVTAWGDKMIETYVLNEKYCEKYMLFFM